MTVLSSREREILCLLTRGRNTKQIAAELGIKRRTVYVHTFNAREKTGCFSTIELAVKAAQSTAD